MDVAANLKSLLDHYCVKEVRECLDEVGKARSAIFSTCNLTTGFLQQSLQEKSRQYTPFSVPRKGARYQWRVTPMGLQGLPAPFTRLMDFVMTGVKGIITYIDDILMHSRDHEQHVKSLEEVLWRIRKYGLKLNVDKTIIGARTVQYLGYTLSGQGVTLLKDKLAAIKDFPMPTSPNAVREFLGLTNYFRLLVPRFSQTPDPLNKMTRASTVWRTWAPPPPEAQVAFNKLKEALMSAPIVVNPDRKGRFILQTDASKGTESAAGGMGAVLLQDQKDKTERVAAYASRGLKDHKRNYPAFLLKKAAACWGIDYFDTYLTLPKQFTLCTDHRPLETMSTVHKKTLNNLQLLMLKFNFVIEYKEGWRNTVANALSRTHAGVLMCVITRSGRRAAEDNSVPAYRSRRRRRRGGTTFCQRGRRRDSELSDCSKTTTHNAAARPQEHDWSRPP
jgi:hypothetical protein